MDEKEKAELKEELAQTILYFWETKKDPFHFCSFDFQKETVKAFFPELLEEWERYQRQEKRIERILKEIESEL
jgi:hypothetical protein